MHKDPYVRRRVIPTARIPLAKKGRGAKFASGQKVDFHQDELRLSLTGLPEKAPDDPVTVIAVECESEPRIDPTFVRKERKRGQV